MSKKKKSKTVTGVNPRLDPETRLTPTSDSTGIRRYPVADRKQMGWQVLDDFAQEHIQ